jgi:hypothetical protein
MVPPRPGCGPELTTRSDAVDLPPFSTGVPTAANPATSPWIRLLDAEAERDTWRIVEVFSRTAAPFDVDLTWSAGTGTGAGAKVTVSRSTRICVFARSLRVNAMNLTAAINRVGITVGDGFAVTSNLYEVRGQADATYAIDIPSFGRRGRLELADPTALAGSVVQVLDGFGTVRASIPCVLQPPDGFAIGGAHRLQLVPSVATDFRAVFTLSL